MTKKSLQKFTEIEKLNTVKQVEIYLSKNPKQKVIVYDLLNERLLKDYKDQLGNEFELEEMICSIVKLMKGKDSGAEIHLRNSLYEHNHTVISMMIHNHIIKNNRFPTISEIHLETNLSRPTVYNHIKDGLGTRFL